MWSLRFFSFASLILSSLAIPQCPLLGPNFPPALNLKTSPPITAASSNLTQLIETAFSTSITPFGAVNNGTSFSLEIFSTSSNDSVYSYHYSSSTLDQDASGVKKVDENTVYRIGSISKLFTVYLLLLDAGDVRFNDPITKYVPELANLAGDRNAIDFVDWSAVTIGELASQTSGIGFDYGLLPEYFVDGVAGFTPDELLSLGLPLLNQSELPLCGVDASKLLCSREDFFKGFELHHPVYAPSTSPTYSNSAFQILGYALESITGKNVSSLLQDGVFEPLNLSRTFYSLPPDESQGVIPGNETESWWSLDLGDESPAGNMYSTSSDLSKFGRAILRSSQLPSSVTRRWMKPRAFSSDGTFTVGAPWEIRLTKQDLNLVDIYTKHGSIGAYCGFLALLPRFEVGFVILSAGLTDAAGTLERIVDIVGEVFIPALEDAAREEANVNYAGRYAASDPSLNSSLVIETDPTGPGLSVTQWISNGSDFSAIAGASLSLYPTGLSDPSTGRVSFRSVKNPPSSTVGDPGVFQRDCTTWIGVDALQYGAVAFDDFTFVLGEDGKAVSVMPRVLRMLLDRT